MASTTKRRVRGFEWLSKLQLHEVNDFAIENQTPKFFFSFFLSYLELKNYALKAGCWNNLCFSPSSYAVDGKKSDPCSVSRSYTTMLRWWQVDLGRTILVSQIIIISKGTCE